MAKPDPSTRRAEVLALSAKLFAENGYRATTVRDIADAAGILSGSLYHHFDSKESMLDEILRDFLDRLFGEYRAVLAAVDAPREQLRGCVIASFAAIDAHPDAVAIYQAEARGLAQQDRFAYIADFLQEFRTMWRGIISRGIESGDFRADLDIDVTYRFLRDTVWVAVRWYRPGGQLPVSTVADQYLTILEHGIASPEKEQS
ncbi:MULTISPECIES: TetR/AcrR family transcriptional regulator [Tsukamurella]|uniref:TetR/AcrR family transcriptional regulator n=2 Tax=Tsukamurella TaxID=2060 RepID=A0A5C5S6I1_9ACTN|nr:MULTISPECIES: TetR/AcrR family transcriptional regulator [Tsukamurella]NMD55775.1 TetR/AcrR family transcriptional regulator [Tsukamurella columbiensis]TWS30462.1 TetR/AcrR family transcriptional regulator [Tsukamurella conjunctivitidis]